MLYYNAETKTLVQNLFPGKVNNFKVNNFLHEEYVKNGFYFIDNSAVTERDLWKDGVHMVKCSKYLIANNFICHLNSFWG